MCGCGSWSADPPLGSEGDADRDREFCVRDRHRGRGRRCVEGEMDLVRFVAVAAGSWGEDVCSSDGLGGGDGAAAVSEG